MHSYISVRSRSDTFGSLSCLVASTWSLPRALRDPQVRLRACEAWVRQEDLEWRRVQPIFTPLAASSPAYNYSEVPDEVNRLTTYLYVCWTNHSQHQGATRTLLEVEVLRKLFQVIAYPLVMQYFSMFIR